MRLRFWSRPRPVPVEASDPEPEPSPSWDALLAEVLRHSPLRDSPLHGDRHWRAVAAVGQEILARRPGGDPAVVLAFAMIHDCRRVDEAHDPDHGRAAAQFAVQSSVLTPLLGPHRRDAVFRACLVHNGGTVMREDPVVGTCLDADRLNLVRVGTTPKTEFMSVITDPAELREMAAFAESVWREPPPWEDLVSSLTR